MPEAEISVRGLTKSFGEQTLLFHYKYLEQKAMGGSGLVGIYILKLADPEQAANIAKTVDDMFLNSSFATHTESEQAFQAGFVSMYGNVPFLIGVIGLAVVFAILLVAANTMMMATRERIPEFGVLKTLGFGDGTLFAMVLAEAAVITLGGGTLGALLAKVVIEGTKFNAVNVNTATETCDNVGNTKCAGHGGINTNLNGWKNSCT